MKVQLQTNYSNRNSAQRTNRTQDFANPNFASTFQVSMPKDRVNKRLFKTLRTVLQCFRPTGIRAFATANGKEMVHIVASFPQQQDAQLMRFLESSLQHEPGIQCRKSPLHELSSIDIRNIDFNLYSSVFLEVPQLLPTVRVRKPHELFLY